MAAMESASFAGGEGGLRSGTRIRPLTTTRDDLDDEEEDYA